VRVDRETEDIIKREVLKLIEAQVRERVGMIVDIRVLAEVRNLVHDQLAIIVGQAVTNFLKKNF
jgi:hypothetical protein